MNHAQKTILLTGALVIALMGVCPPWMRVEPGEPARAMGYGLLWQPPQENFSKRANLFGLELQLEMGPMKANSIDWSRLLTQWVVIGAVTATGFAIARSQRVRVAKDPDLTPRQPTRV
ncbi:MAG: hypothetical protein K2W95_27055 [Candidatus Obscuribacterales bacterium]|nr:hypothetical protein [Candidatus Obscuribacterales bacterium]